MEISYGGGKHDMKCSHNSLSRLIFPLCLLTSYMSYVGRSFDERHAFGMSTWGSIYRDLGMYELVCYRSDYTGLCYLQTIERRLMLSRRRTHVRALEESSQ